MQDTVRAAKVGVLVVGALVAAIVVWRLVDERAQTRRGYRVHAFLDNAHGLITKSRVTVAGIPVGYIDSIRLQDSRARINIVIREEVTLYQDASIARRSSSLLGEYLIAIHPGTVGEEPRLGDGDEIVNVTQTQDTADVMADVGAVARSVRRVAEQAERTFGTEEGGRQMRSALRNLTEALEAVNRTVQTNEQVVNHTLANIEDITTSAQPRIDGILQNVERITGDIRTILEHNRDGLDEGVGEVGPTLASINRAAQELENVLQDVGEVTERTAAGEGTLGRLTSDEVLIDEIEGVAEGVNDLVGGLARLRTIVGLRSEYLFLTNSFKNYLEIRIAPAEDRYFMIQLVDEPRGRTSFTSTQVRTSPPREGEPEFYEEVRATTSESLLFSLQLAKRLDFITFRFGILESSGGIGFDLHLFDDRFEMNTDLFNFSEQAWPSLRVRIAYEIVQTLYVIGGIDNILNSDFTSANLNGGDFFLGAMLRFTDHDLLGLLPFVGGLGSSVN